MREARRMARPPLRGSVRRVPNPFQHQIGLVLLVGVGLPVASTALGLYDRVQHWGKLVHALDAACATLLFGVLLFAWRDLERVDLADELAALMAMCAGVFFGVIWEIVEFVIDWVGNADLQKSNSDTMTDFLWSDLGAAVAAVVAARLYCRRLGRREREGLGGLAVWLVSGP